jgi:hypothetical protein
MENRKVINSFQWNQKSALEYELRHLKTDNEYVIKWLKERIEAIGESGTWLR